MFRLEPLLQGTGQRPQQTCLRKTLLYTFARLSKGHCPYPQVTTSCTGISANHATGTGPRGEAEPIPPPRRALHCPALHHQGGQDAQTEGCSIPLSPCSPAQNRARRLWLPGPESIFSPFFLSTRRHPTKQGAPAFKRILFVGRGLSWISCIHQPTLCLSLLLSGCRVSETPSKSQI